MRAIPLVLLLSLAFLFPTCAADDGHSAPGASVIVTSLQATSQPRPKVPGPLPIAGVAVAFAAARRLRSRCQ